MLYIDLYFRYKSMYNIHVLTCWFGIDDVYSIPTLIVVILSVYDIYVLTRVSKYIYFK